MEAERKVDIDIKIGDTVKSFDFDMVDDCYIQGKVVGFTEMDNCTHFVIHMDKMILKGKDITDYYLEKTCNFKFYPPVNGIETWMGSVTCGVQKYNLNKDI